MALVREGHTVDTAADAWQAIVRLRAQSFDIAVVDLIFQRCTESISAAGTWSGSRAPTGPASPSSC